MAEFHVPGELIMTNMSNLLLNFIELIGTFVGNKSFADAILHLEGLLQCCIVLSFKCQASYGGPRFMAELHVHGVLITTNIGNLLLDFIELLLEASAWNNPFADAILYLEGLFSVLYSNVVPSLKC